MDWLNLDLHASVPGVTVADLTKGIPVDDNSASVVYSAAVLEHIRSHDIPFFLDECRRVLEPGGILRIAVPDLEQQARIYLESISRLDAGELGAELDRQWMVLEMIDQCSREESGGEMLKYLWQDNIPNKGFVLNRVGIEGSDLIDHLSQCQKPSTIKGGNNYSKNVRGGFMGRWILKLLMRSRNLEQDLHSLAIGRFRLQSGEVHQSALDRFSLATLLKTAGFVDLKQCNHGESSILKWPGYNLEVNPDGIVEKPDLLIIESHKPDIKP